MKNKLRFLLPRLIGATIIAGVASFLMFTIFKLLLGITLLAAGVTLIGRSIGRRRDRQFRFQQQQGAPAFGESGHFSKPAPWNGGQMRPFAPAQQRGTIVPIN